MTVDRRLLEILVCPITKVPVKPLGKDKLATLNTHVESGELKYLDGSPVDSALDEGLVTSDGRTVYRVDDGIPVMLEDRGIATEQIPGW